MAYYNNDSDKYELNGPRSSNYGSTWDEETDTQAFLDKDIGGTGEDVEVKGHETPYEALDLYFRDGRRKIDFVLVFEESKTRPELDARENGGDRAERRRGEQTAGSSANRHETWRNKFMRELQRIGLDMEEEVVESEKSTTHFIKLSSPWDVVVHYAQELGFRAKLEAYPQHEPMFFDRFPRCLRLGELFGQTIPYEPRHYLTCPFKASKLDKFIGSENHETYFTNTQRSRVVYEILQTSAYGKRHRAEIGIDRLIQEGAYSAAYPLHEGSFETGQKRKQGRVDRWNRRQILFNFWAKWGRFFKYQPLHHVREYLGEQIAFYFALLGFYTGWLVPAAVVGIMVYFYGLINMNSSSIAEDICESGAKYKMCPKCEEQRGCSYFNLSDTCSDIREAFLYDHSGTVLFAVFISAWSVFFLEFWKRRSIELAHYWDCLGMCAEGQRLRPQFAARATGLGVSHVTGLEEPVFPKSIRLKRMAVGAGITLVMVCVVVIFVIALIVYRAIVTVPLFQNPRTRPYASSVASWSSAILQLFVIMLLGKIYVHVARLITDWEMHRTERDYEFHLTLKVFIFQFVNFYSSVFYIAFIKGRFNGYPGHYSQLFGLRPDECKAGGCLVELADQLFVILVGKQIMNNAVEILVPKIKSFFYYRCRLRKSHLETKARWEVDYELPPHSGLISEYMEIVIQFGFIAMFGATFPLGAVFSLLNNCLEIRLDAHKLICETRRVVAFRVPDVGIWFTILSTVSELAVIGNAFLIAFTTDFVPRVVYGTWYNWDYEGYLNFSLATSSNGTFSEECRYFDYRDVNGSYTSFYWAVTAMRLVFVIVFEFVVSALGLLIGICFPDVPHSLNVKIRREQYLGKQALSDGGNVFKVKEEF